MHILLITVLRCIYNLLDNYLDLQLYINRNKTDVDWKKRICRHYNLLLNRLMWQRSLNILTLKCRNTIQRILSIRILQHLKLNIFCRILEITQLRIFIFWYRSDLLWYFLPIRKEFDEAIRICRTYTTMVGNCTVFFMLPRTYVRSCYITNKLEQAFILENQ